MTICRVLEVTPEELLREDEEEKVQETDFQLKPGDVEILTDYHSFTAKQQKRLFSYMKRIKKGTDEKEAVTKKSDTIYV